MCLAGVGGLCDSAGAGSSIYCRTAAQCSSAALVLRSQRSSSWEGSSREDAPGGRLYFICLSRMCATAIRTSRRAVGLTTHNTKSPPNTTIFHVELTMDNYSR